MGFPRGNSSDVSEISQCEMCARWTHDGRLVPRTENGSERHFICRRCEREANNNSFVRAALDRWERRHVL